MRFGLAALRPGAEFNYRRVVEQTGPDIWKPIYRKSKGPRSGEYVSPKLVEPCEFMERALDLWRLPTEAIELKLMPASGSWAREWAREKAGLRHYSPNATIESMLLRDAYVEHFGFAIPCLEMIESLRWSGRPTWDCMAGSGYLAAAMHAAGLQVEASDNDSWHGGNNWPVQHYLVSRLCAIKEVRRRRGWNVFMSWPYMDDTGYEVARRMHQGQLLYLIGENGGGCTGNDALHDLLVDGFRHIKDVDIPQFYGVHDVLGVYRRSARSAVRRHRIKEEWEM